MSCPVENQIANHCNEEESFCPECEGNMYYDEDNMPDLVCIECGFVIDPLENLEY